MGDQTPVKMGGVLKPCCVDMSWDNSPDSAESPKSFRNSFGKTNVFPKNFQFCPFSMRFKQHLELEAAISTVFATCLNSNISFPMVFAAFWCSNRSCNMVVCN